MIIEILIFLVTFIVAYILYTHKKIKDHFDEHGIRFLPGVPLFGNSYNSSMMKKHAVEDIAAVYKAFPDEKYVGYIDGTVPIIMIRDPELIKNITVKDFDHFVDHRQFFPEELDKLFGGSVFMMRGEKWRDMRTTLSPAFTGAKMKQMMPFMIDISDNIIQYLKDHVDTDIDMGDLIRRYTNDVIASAGFGLQVDSLKDKENEFYMIGQSVFSFTAVQKFYMFFFIIFPNIAKRLKLQLWPQSVHDFFNNVVSKTIDFRRKNNVERPDMIQLLMEASTGKLKAEKGEDEKDVGFATVDEALKPRGNVRQWTLSELTGQVFIFFAAGFESSAGELTMCVHELALNPDAQEKLYQEVKDFKEKNGRVTYDNIGELKYLDAVLNETFRKWSAAIVLDRLCTQAYELPPPRPGAKPYRVNPGDIVYNVVNAIQMDEKYYPQPEKFDPERFSEENKHKIEPCTFMTFGLGPRNCVGSRFAILELKVLLYYLALNFKMVKCDKTLDPIMLKRGDFNMKVEGGTWIRLEARS